VDRYVVAPLVATIQSAVVFGGNGVGPRLIKSIKPSCDGLQDRGEVRSSSLAIRSNSYMGVLYNMLRNPLTC
jgi:hypothetical protein